MIFALLGGGGVPALEAPGNVSAVSEEPTAAAEGPAPATAEPRGTDPAGGEPLQGTQPPEKQPTDPWHDPRLPWVGKPRRVDIACWAAITLSGLYYLALLPFRASLVGTHPIVSVLLNGSTEAIVSAAAFAKVGHGSIIVVLLASIPGLMKFDLIYWWAGRLWGERVILIFSGRGKRSAKFVARVQRSGRWLTWPAVVLSPFLPIPNALVYAVAGLDRDELADVPRPGRDRLAHVGRVAGGPGVRAWPARGGRGPGDLEVRAVVLDRDRGPCGGEPDEGCEGTTLAARAK